MQDAEYFIEKAEECLRLVRQARENADNLEGLANQLMAKAVEIDTDRQRKSRSNESRSKS
jgi:hypothetical protein